MSSREWQEFLQRWLAAFVLEIVALHSLTESVQLVLEGCVESLLRDEAVFLNNPLFLELSLPSLNENQATSRMRFAASLESIV